LEVKIHMASHTIITAGYTILRYFFCGNGNVDSAGDKHEGLTRISGPSTIENK